MARIRTFKPELFSSERVGRLSYPARWTFEALWSLADDYGIVECNARVIKGFAHPHNDETTHVHVEQHLAEMAEPAPRPLIRFFEVDGKRYAEIIGFREHQTISKPSRKRNPTPPTSGNTTDTKPLPEPSRSTPGALPEHYPEEVEVEVEVEVEQSSSSGPVHQQQSTGRDDDDPAPPTVDLTTPHDRARAAATELGRRDQHHAVSAGVAVATPSRHLRTCVDTRWDLYGAELVRLATELPALTATELADLVDPDPARAAHPAGRASPTVAAPDPFVVVDGERRLARTLNCPTCQGRSAHDTGSCPLADPDPGAPTP